MNKENKKIGIIGTGLMGNPMARHVLDAGYKLNVYNRTPAKADNLLGMGALWCESPAVLAARSDVVITIVGFPKDVESCYYGDDGILAAAARGAILIDMSTTKPSLAVDLYNRAQAIGARFVDAPVSGGELGAINASLSIMIGGDRDTVSEVLPLFEVFGKNIIHQGGPGAGQHTKLCNQITIAGTLIGVCEGLLYGVNAGLDLDTLLRSISKGAAQCWSLDVLGKKLVNQDYSPGFTVDNFVKDLSIALEEAASMQLPMPGLSLARQLYASVQAMGKGALGNQALFLALAKLANLGVYADRPDNL